MVFLKVLFKDKHFLTLTMLLNLIYTLHGITDLYSVCFKAFSQGLSQNISYFSF